MNKLLSLFRKPSDPSGAVPVPSYMDRVARAERAFMEEIHNFHQPVSYDEQATELLVEAWDELMMILKELVDPARCSENGVEETNALLERIRDSLSRRADPNAVNVRDFIRAMSTTRALFMDGAVTGFRLLTDLVKSGYEIRDEYIDELATQFLFQIFQRVTGAQWLASKNPWEFLTIGVSELDLDIPPIGPSKGGIFVCLSEWTEACRRHPSCS